MRKKACFMPFRNTIEAIVLFIFMAGRFKVIKGLIMRDKLDMRIEKAIINLDSTIMIINVNLE